LEPKTPPTKTNRSAAKNQPLPRGHEGALRGIRKTVAEVVADMMGNSEKIPEPLATRKFSGKFMVRIPPEVHRHRATEAAEEHISLNRLISAKLTHA